MVDLISYADPLPEVGQTVYGDAFEIGSGGKGANQAVMAHRLGADVTFIARIGQDPFGDISRDNLQAAGLRTDTVRTVEDVPTGVAPIWVTSDGGNRIIVVLGANARMSAAAVREDWPARSEIDAVVCQLEIPYEATAAALAIGTASGAVRILNPAPAHRDAVALFAAADWVVPNEHEFEYLWGDPPTDTAVGAAASHWGCSLVVTLGAKGAVAALAGDVIRVPAPKVTTVDTTGAGDAFVGSLAYGLASRLPPRAAIELGNLCGALSTQLRGTQRSFPTRGLVDRYEPYV
jgi:ribokinase